MDIPAIQWSTAVEQASWVAERLDPFGTGVMTSVVPGGFAAYARLLHPVETSRGVHHRTVRWAEVAAWSGISLTPQAQFHDIALPKRSPTAPAPWHSQGPDKGTLSEHDAEVLVDLLQAHTTTPDCCWFCLWDGYGWDTTTYLTFAGDEGTVPDPPGRPDPVPGWLRDGPRVRFPSRDYFLYTGPVTTALAFVHGERQTPNLWWPADRSWCVASEIDLAWTYLAGPRTLIETVLADPRLEALPAQPVDNFHFRVRGWLVEAIEAAVTGLLDSGNAALVTSRGTVYARLQRPTRRRRGLLHTTYDGANGVSGSGATPLNHTPDDELRRQVSSYLTITVAGLV